MKKLLLLLLGLSAPALAANPIISYVQISSGPIQTGGFSTQTGVINNGLSIPYVGAGVQCLRSVNGAVSGTGLDCGAGGATGSSNTIVASPQFEIPFYSAPGSTNTLTGASGFSWFGSSASTTGPFTSAGAITGTSFALGSGVGTFASGADGFQSQITATNGIYLNPTNGKVDVYDTSNAVASGSEIHLHGKGSAYSSNYVGFKATDTIPSSITWVLPGADGVSGQCLSTDGAAHLSWVTASGGSSALPLPAGATNYIQVSNTLQSGSTFYVSSGTIAGSLGINNNGTIAMTHLVTGTPYMTLNDDQATIDVDYLAKFTYQGLTNGYFGFTNSYTGSGGSGLTVYDLNQREFARFDWLNYRLSVGTNTSSGINTLNVGGNASIGAGAMNVSAPPNGLLVQGGIIASSASINGSGDGQIILSIGNSTYTVAASSTPITIGHEAVFLSTSGAIGDLGATGTGSFINNQATLQSGATFFVSSGTVSGGLFSVTTARATNNTDFAGNALTSAAQMIIQSFPGPTGGFGQQMSGAFELAINTGTAKNAGADYSGAFMQTQDTAGGNVEGIGAFGQAVGQGQAPAYIGVEGDSWWHSGFAGGIDTTTLLIAGYFDVSVLDGTGHAISSGTAVDVYLPGKVGSGAANQSWTIYSIDRDPTFMEGRMGLGQSIPAAPLTVASDSTTAYAMIIGTIPYNNFAPMSSDKYIMTVTTGGVITSVGNHNFLNSISVTGSATLGSLAVTNQSTLSSSVTLPTAFSYIALGNGNGLNLEVPNAANNSFMRGVIGSNILWNNGISSWTTAQNFGSDYAAMYMPNGGGIGFTGTNGIAANTSYTNAQFLANTRFYINSNGDVGVNMGASVPNTSTFQVLGSTTQLYAASFGIGAGAPFAMNITTTSVMTFNDQTSSGTVSACGTGPVLVGGPNAATITGGTGATGCVYTFPTGTFVKTPVCNVTEQTGSVINVFSYSYTNAAVTVTQTGFGTDKIDIHCTGRD